MSTAEERAAARAAAHADEIEARKYEDFIYDKQSERYWNVRNGMQFSDKSVDSNLPKSEWRLVLDEKGKEKVVPPRVSLKEQDLGSVVDGAVWWPGMPMFLEGYVASPEFGIKRDPKGRLWNRYDAPTLAAGRPEGAAVWVDLVRKLYPDDADTFLDYCAHMIQRPEQKCNWAVVLSGEQGIGKDSLLQPLREALGHWNVGDASPDAVMSAYRPWVERVMLVVSETSPTEREHGAIAFYNRMKTLITAPPDFLVYTNKYEKERCVVNVLRCFLTTNHYQSMFIPKDDRRLFLMHSKVPARWHEAAGMERYFVGFYANRALGADVKAYLLARNLANFDVGQAPESSEAKAMVQDLWEGEPEDEVATVLEAMGHPDIVFGSELLAFPFDGHREIMALLKSPSKTLHRLSRSGYAPVKAEDGSPWLFQAHGKKPVRANPAWVKKGLAADLKAARAAIRAHGAALLGRGAALKAV